MYGIAVQGQPLRFGAHIWVKSLPELRAVVDEARLSRRGRRRFQACVYGQTVRFRIGAVSNGTDVAYLVDQELNGQHTQYRVSDATIERTLVGMALGRGNLFAEA